MADETCDPVDWRTRALAAESRAERAEVLLKDVMGEISQHRTDSRHGGVDDERLWSYIARIDAHLSGKAKEE